MNKQKDCDLCHGDGHLRCATCDGHCYLSASGSPSYYKDIEGHTDCYVCHGHGKVPCNHCHGSGKVIDYSDN